MKQAIFFVAFFAALAIATVFTATEASAATVTVKFKATVASPFLVATPPRPIVRPSRITMVVYNPDYDEVPHVRLFGHHHHHHYVVVGPERPYYRVRARVFEPRVVVRVPERRVRIHRHERPGVRVHVEAPRPPSVRVDVGVGGRVHHRGPGHIGPPGHFRGGPGHHGPRGKVKVRF